MTGQDIVNALTQAGFLDKDIESFETFTYYEQNGPSLKLVFEESSKYIGNDERQFNDINLIINHNGTWRLEHVTWVG